MLLIYVAITAPLLIAVFIVKRNVRRFLAFFVIGLTVCLVSAYINAFLAAAAGMSRVEAIIKLTPISEELLKALPVFFYMAVYAPKRGNILSCAVAVGLGFALLENVHALMNVEAGLLPFAVIRGFSAAILHTVCGAVLGQGLAYSGGRRYLALPTAFGLLCMTSTAHAIYNLFISADGAWSVIGYLLPFVAAFAVMFALRGRPILEETDE